jgi:hypothetical protein
MWLGPRPRIFIMDPDKIKEMTNKVYDFQKPDTSPLFKLLASGFANYDGDKWAKHRKIVSPAFNVEKMKVSFYYFFWRKIVFVYIMCLISLAFLSSNFAISSS